MDGSKVEEIINSREKYEDIINLYYNDNLIPYDIEDNYYLFHIANFKEYEKIYTDASFKANIINQEDEYTISIIIYNNNYYKISEIKLTNIPVISMNIEDIVNEENYGDMYLYSSNDKFNVTDTIHYNCEFHIRGDTSRISSKKSYKLNIMSNKGKSVSISMLGMNSDSDWVLNPLWLDNSYIREKIGYDIWNSLNNEYNHKMEYIELVIDNKYQGIYCLQEVVDLDTFSADENKDLLLSIKKYNEEIINPILFDYSYNENTNIIDEFEFEKGLENDYNLKINLLRTLVNNTNNQQENDIHIKYDFENNANYSIFINLILAVDNRYKNEKILFRDNGDYYTIQKTPWDLDLTILNERASTLFNLDIDEIFDIKEILKDYTLPSWYNESEEFKKYQKEQYFKIRESIYNEETLNNMIDTYIKYLTDNGAIERDTAKWGNNSFKDSCQIIKDFFKERIAILDNYYGGL